MRIVLAAAFIVAAAGVAQAHPCDEDAIAKATPLLKLHYEADDDTEVAIDDHAARLNRVLLTLVLVLIRHATSCAGLEDRDTRC